jgi:2,3-bisphosphoglycerate-dependent phosphoglycerate mutase
VFVSGAAKLILMRHGQSEWNKKNLFTGWVDIPLSLDGVHEAMSAGRKMASWPIDVIFVSSLIRAQMTAMLVMAEHKEGRVPVVMHEGEGKLEDWSKIYSPVVEQHMIPVFVSSALNERMYGKLQGLNKQETIEKFGAEQVKIWRRSYDVCPPDGESLEMTAARAIPYFEEKIMPCLLSGKNVLVSAHGNSLRAIVMDLLKLTKEQVLNLELSTGEPLVFSLKDGMWSRE